MWINVNLVRTNRTVRRGLSNSSTVFQSVILTDNFRFGKCVPVATAQRVLGLMKDETSCRYEWYLRKYGIYRITNWRQQTMGGPPAERLEEGLKLLSVKRQQVIQPRPKYWASANVINTVKTCGV